MTVFFVARLIRLGQISALALGLAGLVGLRAGPVQQPAASPPSVRSDDPDDYVQVRNGRFVLAGKPFVIRGTNYFGSWRFNATINMGNGVEHENEWAFFNDWDAQKVNLDFKFIASKLRATAVRIGTPTLSKFESLVRYHQYAPWYDTDGSISDRYKAKLLQLADTAYNNNIRIQFCLLWNLGNEIASNGDAFKPGAQMDRFYSNQIRSIAMALRNHPGVLGFSVGNEVMVKWPINGTQRSWYEARAGGFILRRLNDLRALAPRLLLTTDEIAAPGAKNWHDPGPDFALLPDTDDSNDGHPFRLVDKVHYLGPHFYSETLTIADLKGGFASKIDDAKDKLQLYMQAARAIGKPVAVGEFGLKLKPPTLPPEQYTEARDRYFEQFLAGGEKLGLQGLLAWGALPAVALRDGHYSVRESKVNPYSPTEVDVDDASAGARRILFYTPSFALFTWHDDSDEPIPSRAANAIASAWPGVPLPDRRTAGAVRR